MYVYKNMCGMLSLVDILFLLVLSSGRLGQMSIDCAATADLSIVLNCMVKS
jgi:hypothetical protein